MPFGEMRGRRVCIWACSGIVALGAAGVWPCFAQDGKVVPSTPGNPYTLHVYENLVQVPTLVLNKLHATEAGLVPEDFTIRLDAGPKFHPSKVRVEGDDPLTVAVVIDATSAVPPGMLMNFVDALGSLPEGLLSERDHVSVYAVDCGLARGPQLDFPARKKNVAAAVAAVLGSTGLHGEFKLGMGCDDSRRLWDAVAKAAQDIGSLPGRRVMIVLSDGNDHGSVNNWNRVREYVDGMSVAVFGVRSDGPPPLGQAVVKTVHGATVIRVAEDRFGLWCGGTGGITLDADVNTVGLSLERALRLVRQRYILEFQRPRNSVSGIHLMDVRVPDREAIVRPGGVMVKLQDPVLAKDPSTVPSDDSRAPLLGSRRALTSPN